MGRFFSWRFCVGWVACEQSYGLVSRPSSTFLGNRMPPEARRFRVHAVVVAFQNLTFSILWEQVPGSDSSRFGRARRPHLHLCKRSKRFDENPEFVLNANWRTNQRALPLIEYNGVGKATVVACRRAGRPLLF